jgi:hypothetical protein
VGRRNDVVGTSRQAQWALGTAYLPRLGRLYLEGTQPAGILLVGTQVVGTQLVGTYYYGSVVAPALLLGLQLAAAALYSFEL